MIRPTFGWAGTLLVALAVVGALAGPVWAGGDRVTHPSVVMPRSTFKAGALPPSLPFVVGTRPFRVTPSGAIVPDHAPVFVPGPGHRPRHHRHTAPTFISSPTTTQVVIVPGPAPQPVYYPVFVAPCVIPGYWSYRWVPFTTTENVWVPGSWAADGTWVDSRWEARPYSSGYYEPFYVPDRGC
jgi:hypothetical protein